MCDVLILFCFFLYEFSDSKQKQLLLLMLEERLNSSAHFYGEAELLESQLREENPTLRLYTPLTLESIQSQWDDLGSRLDEYRSSLDLSLDRLQVRFFFYYSHYTCSGFIFLSFSFIYISIYFFVFQR